MQEPHPGSAVPVEPDVVRITAPNPSPLTGAGTNTYVVGRREIAIIDPGPDIPAHLEAILAALPSRARVSHILVTHAHLDHSALAPGLAAVTGAAILAFGGALSGRSPRMDRFASLGGGEGLDLAFRPDITLADGQRIETADWTMTALHTPGHLGGHLCFALGEILFSGDHAMGWSTSLVSPPDGDMTDYMTSLHRLAQTAPARLLPGHGPIVADALKRLADLVAHRHSREAAILAALGAGPSRPEDIARRVYTDTPPALLPAATRNVLAHLIDLAHRNLVIAEEEAGHQTSFRAA